MAHHAVLVVEAIVGTGVVGALHKSVHLVLVEIYHTDVAVVVLVINIVGAGLAVGGGFLLH